MASPSAVPAGADLLPLDDKIRDNVLFPMIFLTITMNLARHYATQLMSTKTLSTKPPTKPESEASRTKQILARSQRLRSNSFLLSPNVFETRRELFTNKKNGLLRPHKKKTPPANPMQDPSQMNNMMKQQMVNMVPNMVMMGFVSYFFSGFVLLKAPFPVTNGFREMLQRGVLMTTLDVSYVSSLSVYFMLMFGLNGVFTLLLSGSMTEDLTAGMGMQMQQQQQQKPFDANALCQQERDSLDLVQHRCAVGKEAERKVLARLGMV